MGFSIKKAQSPQVTGFFKMTRRDSSQIIPVFFLDILTTSNFIVLS